MEEVLSAKVVLVVEGDIDAAQLEINKRDKDFSNGLSSLRASAAKCADADSLKEIYKVFFEVDSNAYLRSLVTEAASSPSFVFNQISVDPKTEEWLDFFKTAAFAGSELPTKERLEAAHQRFLREGAPIISSFEKLRKEFVDLNKSRNSQHGPGFGAVPFHSRIFLTAGSSQRLTRSEQAKLNFWFYERWYALYPKIIQKLLLACEGSMRVKHGSDFSQRQRVKN